MGRDGNTLSAVIRQAWDRGDLRTMTKNCPAQATGANASGVHVVEFRYLSTGTKSADFQVKATPGFVHNMVCIGLDASATAGTIILYNNTAESGIAVFTFTPVVTANYSLTPLVFPIDVAFATGIYLGFTTVADMACTVAFGGPAGALLSDDFNRANSGTLGANWTTITGYNPQQIASNSIYVTALGVASGDVSTRPLPPHQWGQVTIYGWSGTSDQYGKVLQRFNASTKSGYACFAGRTSSQNYIAIERYDNNVLTSFGFVLVPWASLDVLRCDVVGSTISASRNGVVKLTAVDPLASYASGSFGLSQFVTSGSTSDLSLDDATAGGVPY